MLRLRRASTGASCRWRETRTAPRRLARFSARLKWTRPTRCQAGLLRCRNSWTVPSIRRSSARNASSISVQSASSTAAVMYSAPVIGGAAAASASSSSSARRRDGACVRRRHRVCADGGHEPRGEVAPVAEGAGSAVRLRAAPRSSSPWPVPRANALSSGRHSAAGGSGGVVRGREQQMAAWGQCERRHSQGIPAWPVASPRLHISGSGCLPRVVVGEAGPACVLQVGQRHPLAVVGSSFPDKNSGQAAGPRHDRQGIYSHALKADATTPDNGCHRLRQRSLK